MFCLHYFPSVRLPAVPIYIYIYIYNKITISYPTNVVILLFKIRFLLDI